MRREYEAAVGRLITNPMALRLFLENEESFLRDYELDDMERESIISMKSQLSAMSLSFAGKRKRNVERPVTRSVALLGEYGQTLMRRYINIFPPSGDYSGEHEALVRFLEEALSSAEGIDNLGLIQNVLRLESMLFHSLRSVIPGEELEHLNDPAPDWTVEADSETVVVVRPGVYYGLFDYNLTDFVQMNDETLSVLEPQQTALIVLRHFGEVTNTIMRVSATVLQALDVFKDGLSVEEAAAILSVQSGSPHDVTLANLKKLVNQLCSQQVLMKVKE